MLKYHATSIQTDCWVENHYCSLGFQNLFLLSFLYYRYIVTCAVKATVVYDHLLVAWNFGHIFEKGSW